MRLWDALRPWALENNISAYEYIERQTTSGTVANAKQGLRRLAEVMAVAGAHEALAPAIEAGLLDDHEARVDELVIGIQVSWKAWLVLQRGTLSKEDMDRVLDLVKHDNWRLIAISPQVGEVTVGKGTGEEASGQGDLAPQRTETIRRPSVVGQGQSDVRERHAGPVALRQGGLFGG